MRRELGKELVLLAWAIEDADPALIPQRAGQLEWPGARRTLVALHADGRRHRPRHQRPQQGLAQGRALCADRKPGHRRAAEAVVPEYFRQAAAGPLFKMVNDAGDDDGE